MEKSQLRNQVLTDMRSLDSFRHENLSRKITDRFIESDKFKSAYTIGITISRFPEVDTHPIIEAAWQAGKRIAVPKCEPFERTMDFRLLTAYDCLETVYMDLLEPIINKTRSIRKEEIDLQIVPGVVFDDRGFRIGFGGGYYDRYMKFFKGRGVSLAFEFQTGYTIPIETHDIPVEMIFTPDKVIDCRRDS